MTKRKVTPADGAAAEKVIKAPRAKKETPPTTLTPEEADALLDAAAENPEVPLIEVVKETKRRKPSARERDPDTKKVVRKGRNLSGNQPFRRKLYFLDTSGGAEQEKAIEACPMQVRLILRYMRDQKITSPSKALVGGEIAGGAINSGALQSKIDPAALFAYYRRVMEKVGLTLVQGSVDEEEGEE